jgi:hypothetical protein
MPARLTISLVAFGLGIGADALAWEQGGYVYNRGEDRFVDNVYNFLKHFSYEQYYWAEAFEFTTSNNSYVDEMDFAYYSGHGSAYSIGMGPGAGVSSVNLANNSSASWGDRDLEFIVFQSCSVIPSAADRSDWADAWVPDGIFQGLHQAIGYRTLSYSGNGISNNFGERISDGDAVWQAWFAAVDDERSWWKGQDYPGLASAVMHPSTQNDTHFSFAADPPAGHYSLTNWYQHW